MTVVNAIFSNFYAFLMCIIMTVFPYAGAELPVIDNAKADCRLNIQMISDTHIEKNEAFRQSFLRTGLRNISNAGCEVDALLVDGDITNYADEASLSKYFEIIEKYSQVPVISVAGNHDIGHAGDRDVTNISREEAKANFIRYRNENMGIESPENYYSYVLKGYKFIVLGDDCVNGGHFDAMDISPEQMAFLDRELSEAEKDGKPVFVCCHWPVDEINGQATIWPGSGIDLEKNNVKSVMEKYSNVFYISGHMHAGIKSTAVDKYFGLSNVEQVNGVTYINLPTYGIVNMFGDPVSGTGMQVEVYDDEVIIRPRNFITNHWYTNSVYKIEIMN